MALAWPLIAAGSAAAQDTWTVTPGSSGACDTTDPTCATIQAAISAASEGDTINVGPGTYTGTVTVNKAVILNGAADHASVISGGYTVVDMSAAATLNGFTISGPTSAQGVLTHPGGSGYTITNNVFEDNVIGLWLGSEGTNKTTVTGNVFQNGVAGPGGPAGIYVDNTGGGLHNAVIANNTFSGMASAGINLGSASDVSITDNEITGNGSGIVLGGGNSDVTITGNTLTGNGTGISISNEYGMGENSGLGVTGNNIHGNTTGVSVGSDSLSDDVDATDNWWGSPSGPGSGDIVVAEGSGGTVDSSDFTHEPFPTPSGELDHSHTYLDVSPRVQRKGAAVTLTAHVSCAHHGVPTGDVTFYGGGAVARHTIPLVDGVATEIVRNLPLGVTVIAAHYSGNSVCQGSTSGRQYVLIYQGLRPPHIHINIHIHIHVHVHVHVRHVHVMAPTRPTVPPVSGVPVTG